MGDRCYMEIECRRSDVAVFEKLGFLLQHDHANSNACMADAERYPETEDMPTNIPYVGFHGSGASYGEEVFACDGVSLVTALASLPHRTPLAHIDEEGKPVAQDLAEALRYWEVRKRAEAMMAHGSALSMTIKIYLYNENCVMKGRPVPTRVLDAHEDPDNAGDWTAYEGTPEDLLELAAGHDKRGCSHGWEVARQLRAAAYDMRPDLKPVEVEEAQP